ncbi:unnamed protein product, partial [Symbiodinium pilosum]
SACPRSRPCWHDNVHSAFGALRRLRPARGGVDPEVFAAFLRLLTVPLPGRISEDLSQEFNVAAA